MFRKLFPTLLLTLIAGTAFTEAQAQPWPAKQVRIMVGASPGGGTDIIARMLGEKYQALFKEAGIKAE